MRRHRPILYLCTVVFLFSCASRPTRRDWAGISGRTFPVIDVHYSCFGDTELCDRAAFAEFLARFPWKKLENVLASQLQISVDTAQITNDMSAMPSAGISQPRAVGKNCHDGGFCLFVYRWTSLTGELAAPKAPLPENQNWIAISHRLEFKSGYVLGDTSQRDQKVGIAANTDIVIHSSELASKGRRVSALRFRFPNDDPNFYYIVNGMMKADLKKLRERIMIALPTLLSAACENGSSKRCLLSSD